MTISGTCGNQIVSTREELLVILRSSRSGAFGEFWCGERGCPTLAIHMNGDAAYLHFFPTDRHPGFQAVGDKDAKGNVTFTQEGEVDFSMPRTVVVSIARAYEAAAQFFERPSLPSCIEWTEL
jgi:hypothetical protein